MRRSVLALLFFTACNAAPSVEGPRPSAPGSSVTATAPGAPGEAKTPAPAGPITQPTESNAQPTTTDPAAADPFADPSNQVAGILGKKIPPASSACSNMGSDPITTQADAEMAGGVGLTNRTPSMGERKGGMSKDFLLDPHDLLERGAMLDPVRAHQIGTIHTQGGGGSDLDSDGDCLSDAAEAKAGTDPHNADSDGDGWFDGACNERRKLVLQSAHVYESQDWSLFGGDDFYLVADDIRYPNSQDSLDDYWDGWKTDSEHWVDAVVAQRTRGKAPQELAVVQVDGFDDDFEIFNAWTVDDLLVSDSVDLAAYKDGETFTRRYKHDDWDYALTFRVEIEHFADPDPLHDADTDKDGIKESDEAKVAVDFGGVVDPTRPDALVEVDWMTGHGLRTEAKRQVATRLASRGINLFIWRDEELPVDDCLSVKEAQAVYKAHFTNLKYNAFRYAVIGEQIWNDASGVSWGDIFLVDDSTWWIDGGVQAQAGTFIHELGHSMGLTKSTFHWIDSIAWLSYDSAMNYTFQALLVNYGDETNDDWHHDDWADVRPGEALQWSFALVASDEKGICK